MNQPYLPAIHFASGLISAARQRTNRSQAEPCPVRETVALTDESANIDTLQGQLQECLTGAGAHTAAPAIAEDSGAQARATVYGGAAQPVDISTLTNLVGDDRDRHCRLFQSFLLSTPEIIGEMGVAIEDKQRATERIWQLAHKLKSSARSLGAHELADTCEALEISGKAEQSGDAQQLVAQLDSQIGQVTAFMKHYIGSDPAPTPTPVDEAVVENPGVLLLDDDRMSLEMATMMFSDLGIDDVLVADSGGDALNMIGESDGSIDLVMCDLNMPGMDGLEFLRHLSIHSYSGAVVLVSGEDEKILVTAERLAREHRLNVLGFVEKPVRPDDITRLLAKLQQRKLTAKPDQSHQAQIMVTAEELQHAIANDELVTFFQPKIDVSTREIVGMETLVRWQHPEKGMIAPFLFIPIAEENGLINALTQVVLKQALRRAADLQASGFDIKLAVNISVETLNDLDWPDHVSAQCTKFGVDPSSIIFEVTESQLIENLATALEILTRLGMKKFKLSVDDFGTGYASMEQLQRAPFSELKIDRAFVNGARNDRSALAILESSVALAKRLDLNIVAEGVETQEDWDLVAELGCDQVQGYFIAKPMPFAEVEEWLRQWSDAVRSTGTIG